MMHHSVSRLIPQAGARVRAELSGLFWRIRDPKKFATETNGAAIGARVIYAT
jgi:hypothetical protein